MSDDLNRKFNIIPAPKPDPTDIVEVIAEDISMDSAIKDFTTARSNIVSILDVGSQAITSLGDLAHNSQDAEHYMALSSMIKSMTQASTKLIDVHQKLEYLKDAKSKKTAGQGALSGPEQVHNHIHFTGSTSDLAAAIKSLPKT